MHNKLGWAECGRIMRHYRLHSRNPQFSYGGKKIFTQQDKFSEYHIMEKHGMEVKTLSSRQNVD